MRKKSLEVGGFTVAAWIDEDGLMRVEVRSAGAGAVVRVDHPAHISTGDSEVAVFSNNPAIVDFELDPRSRWAGADRRINSKLLRKAGKDPIFRAWWMRTNHGETPEATAAGIEQKQAEERAGVVANS